MSVHVVAELLDGVVHCGNVRVSAITNDSKRVVSLFRASLIWNIAWHLALVISRYVPSFTKILFWVMYLRAMEALTLSTAA